MKDHGQFGDKPAGKSANVPSDKLDCAAVELLWVEAAEGTLTPAVAERVRAHTTDCASCREKISQARKGREWLLMLKLEPLVPPSDLVAKILARTSGVAEASHPRWSTPKIPSETETHATDRYSLPGYASLDSESATIADENVADNETLGREGIAAVPVWQRPSVVLLRKTVFEPRMALVAAMAFFSISLTLNLVGVKLTSFRASDLEPQAMRRAVTRQYAQANARVVHYYENLRIVYEVESRVHQLRQAADSAPVQEKTTYPQGKQGSGRDGQGRPSDRNDKSDREGVHRERMDLTPVKDQNAQRNRSTPVEPAPVFSGPMIDASMSVQPLYGLNAVERGRPRVMSAVLSEFVCPPASQASSHLFQLRRFSVPERNSA
ncbi:MAG TPA: zf-HC2 domain-containing protein [Acidobacteriaceae bacterium]|nr:zf-HC2 domain-containing protein [Acidobacteriaceae bacterium]